jgi:hypothetical protein
MLYMTMVSLVRSGGLSYHADVDFDRCGADATLTYGLAAVHLVCRAHADVCMVSAALMLYMTMARLARS